MAEQTVTLQPGESKVVTFEAIPHEARTYQVSVNGLSGSFKAIGAAKFYVPTFMTKKTTPEEAPYTRCEAWCPITNKGDASGVHTVHVWDSYGAINYSFQVSLSPGETYTWYIWRLVDFSRISRWAIYLQGNWVGYNTSEAVFP